MDLVRPRIADVERVFLVARGPVIKALRILPPLAIGRLGAARTPMDNYRAEVDPDRLLGYRRLVPDRTLIVDAERGTLTSFTPSDLRFTEAGKVRPVAPFLEVWAEVGKGQLVPLTEELLAANKLALQWCVHVGNHKVYRRTKHEDDKIESHTGWFSDHKERLLDYDSRQKDGRQCKNFWPDAKLPLGSVRFIAPNPEFLGIRLRFTPAAGYVYGSSRTTPERNRPPTDKNLHAIVYAAQRAIRPRRGRRLPKGRTSWLDYLEPDSGRRGAELTQPGSIFFGRSVDGGGWHSNGYVDDECDGVVHVRLMAGETQLATAYARIGAGPPAYAPDSMPVRTVADELEQALLGPVVTDGQMRELEQSGEDLLAHAEDIVRRAFGTIRLMNTQVMNGIVGDSGPGNNMDNQDTSTGRAREPIMDPALVDPASLESLHQHVVTALKSGTAPWFVDVLRKHDEIGDLSNKGRRKMPALMRGADARHLALTRRQVDLIRRVASGDIFADTNADSPAGEEEQ